MPSTDWAVASWPQPGALVQSLWPCPEPNAAPGPEAISLFLGEGQGGSRCLSSPPPPSVLLSLHSPCCSVGAGAREPQKMGEEAVSGQWGPG